MNNLTKSLVMLLAGAVLGAALMFFGYSGGAGSDRSDSADSGEAAEQEPLYWVAPMDPNYKRDKPGKSPMGMDLIPVYADSGAGAGEDWGPGTVRISPDVVNNLGVRTAKAVRASLHSEIKTVGYVQYDEDKLVHIHARVEGWVEKLFVKASGDPVVKGEALYALYSPALVNAQQEIVLALNRGNPRLIQAAEERLRALQIPGRHIRQLKKTRKVSQTVTFYAPISGVVDNLNIRPGFFVKPDKTLMIIGALDEVWVEAEVFERQSSLVQVGMRVTMSLNYLPGKTWRGKVDYVYPTLDPKTRTIKVRLRFDNADGKLKPNMFAQVTIHAQSKERVLIVPREAVIRTGDSDRIVLVLGEGRFKSVNVEVGSFDEQHAEILQGVEEGESVVTSAQFLIDSESSKSSDFKRMNHAEGGTPDAGLDGSSDDVDATAEVDGVINTIMVSHRMLNISRGPIPEWNRPAATLDFVVDESIDLAGLREGMSIHFTFVIDDGVFMITGIQVLSDDGITSPAAQQESST